jgi:hypothetical protein
MLRLRAERGSWMGSMQMAGCMKRVEVIGLGELYKVGQSVQSKRRHQNPQISRRNSPQNQPSKRRSRLGRTKGCNSHRLIRALILKTSACFCQRCMNLSLHRCDRFVDIFSLYLICDIDCRPPLPLYTFSRPKSVDTALSIDAPP